MRLNTIVLLAALTLLASGCSIMAPNYQPQFDNIRTLRNSSTSPVKLGEFKADPAAADKINKVTLRLSPLQSPYNGSYTDYLKEAIRQELNDAGRLSENSKISISGVLLKNEMDASGVSTGSGSIEARFIVQNDNTVRYDKVKSANHEWPSSFLGPVAIPAAQQAYLPLVQKLLAVLYGDLDFLNALK